MRGELFRRDLHVNCEQVFPSKPKSLAQIADYVQRNKNHDHEKIYIMSFDIRDIKSFSMVYILLLGALSHFPYICSYTCKKYHYYFCGIIYMYVDF